MGRRREFVIAPECECGHSMGEHSVTAECLVVACPCRRLLLRKIYLGEELGKDFKKPYREMTERERYAARSLAGCVFLPASWNKRFAFDISAMTRATESQVWNLWRLVYRYRRQIADKELVREAKEKMNIEHSTSNVQR